MANSIEKGRLKQKNGTDTVELHPHTDADVVSYTHNASDTQPLSSAENVQQALDRIINAGVGVTDVKGKNNASLLGTGANKSIATVTPANIGAASENITVNDQPLTGNVTITLNDLGGIPMTQKNAASGVAPLDANSKVPTANLPDFLMGQMIYGGTVNSSGTATLSSNAKAKLGLSSATVALPNTPTDVYEGIYFLGDSTCSDSTVKGVAKFSVGDWLIAAGSAWKKIDNTDAVTSVNGNIGAVNLSGNELKFGSTSDTQTIREKVEELEASIGDVSDEVDGLSGANIPYASASDSTTIKGKVDAVDAKIAVTNATVSATGSGNAVTSISISGGQIVANSDTKFATEASLSNYAKLKDANAFKGAINTFSGTVQIGSSANNLTSITGSDVLVQKTADDVTTATEYQPGKITQTVNAGTVHTLTIPSKDGTLLVDTDIAGKANLSGGNSFDGTQNICVDGLTGPAYEGTGVNVYNNANGSVPEYHTIIKPYGILVYQGATAGSSNGYSAFEKTKIRVNQQGTEYTYNFPNNSGTLLTTYDIGTTVAAQSSLANVAHTNVDNNFSAKQTIDVGSGSGPTANALELKCGNAANRIELKPVGIQMYASSGYMAVSPSSISVTANSKSDTYNFRTPTGATYNIATDADVARKVDHGPDTISFGASGGSWTFTGGTNAQHAINVMATESGNSSTGDGNIELKKYGSSSASSASNTFKFNAAGFTATSTSTGNGATWIGVANAVQNYASKANLAYPSGVDELPFSCVTVNKQGIVTGGAQSIMLVENGDPNDDLEGLADGGWFFEKDPVPAAS